jgi:2-enoate reductase
MLDKNSEQSLDKLLDHFDTWIKDGQTIETPRMTSNLYPYENLFSPIQVNSIRIKNRIVMGPMGNVYMVEETGRPSNKMIQYFTERARGGVGLITSGLVPTSQKVDPTVTEPGGLSILPRINNRSVFSGWRILAESIHAYGAHFFIQLTPGLGRVGSPEVLLTKYTLPVSASWNPNYYMPNLPCRPLTDGQCRAIIKATGQAAADARALLIDGVYLHGHEGYLLEQMTNPAYNRRKLGHYANWQAFGIDTVKEIRKRTAPGYPIMYRIDLSLALNAAYGKRMQTVSNLKKFAHERTIVQTLDYMVNLVKAGVDLFDVDLGCYDNWWLPHPPNSMPSGCYLEVSQLVKEYFDSIKIISNAGIPVPIVGVGKLGYPDLAEKALREGKCDMVMLARPLLADPAWANKAYSGKVNEITPCIGDQEACLNEFIEGGHPQCSVNPRTGFEEIYNRELQPAAQKKKIAVIGAGPAGILCAATASRRGHTVTLFEKNNRIGGMLVPGSTPLFKYEVGNYLAYLEGLLETCCQNNGLNLTLNREAGFHELKEKKFDTIVVCTGSKPIVPPVPGVNSPIVLQAVDVFRNPAMVAKANQIVIVGGGAVGCEMAHFLASEKGKRVTVVEMLPYFMKGICTANRAHIIHILEKIGVQLLNCSRLKEITSDAVIVSRNVSKTVPDPFNTWNPILPENIPNPLARPIKEELRDEVIKADCIILAIGLKPDPSLYDELRRENLAAEIVQIGDGFQVGRVFEAVKAGFSVGRTI